MSYKNLLQEYLARQPDGLTSEYVTVFLGTGWGAECRIGRRRWSVGGGDSSGHATELVAEMVLSELRRGESKTSASSAPSTPAVSPAAGPTPAPSTPPQYRLDEEHLRELIRQLEGKIGEIKSALHI